MAVQESIASPAQAAPGVHRADWKSILLMMVNPAGVLRKRMAAISPVWALGPMVATIREMTGQKISVSIMVASVCGGLLLGWSVLSPGISWS